MIPNSLVFNKRELAYLVNSIEISEINKLEYCFCCHNYETTIHHIIPLSLGGLDIPENRIALCKSCHRTIHDIKDILKNKTNQERFWIERIKKLRVINGLLKSINKLLPDFKLKLAKIGDFS